MIGKDLTFKQQESYYFLFVPKRLFLKTEAPESTSTFRMAIHKGVQKIESTKTPIPAEFSQEGVLDVIDTQMKFNLPNFSPYKKVEFVLKVFINDGKQQTDVGTLTLDTVKLINSFKNQKVNSFTQNVNISQYLDLEYTLCVEKSLYNLERQSKSARKAGSEVGSLKGSASLDRQEIQRSSATRRSSRPVISSSIQQPTEEPTPTPPPRVQARSAIEKSQTSSKKRSGVSSEIFKVQSASKDSDVRERVNKLQNQSQQDYSLHAPKAKGTELKKNPVRQTTLKQSRLKRQVDAEKQKQAEMASSKSDINWKQLIFKALLLLVSFFAIYYAMTPSKRYYSHKRRH